MSLRSSGFVASVGNIFVTILGSDENSQDDITGVGAAASTLYAVEVDCTENTGEDVYVRFFNDSSTVTVGTDTAEVVVWGKSGKKVTYLWGRGIPFSAGISVATVRNAGATSGATGPSGTVNLNILCKDS